MVVSSENVVYIKLARVKITLPTQILTPGVVLDGVQIDGKPGSF